METLERFLAEHDFFAGLEPDYLRLLVGCASNVRFDRHAYLFREGEQADHFYLVRSGRAPGVVRSVDVEWDQAAGGFSGFSVD